MPTTRFSKLQVTRPPTPPLEHEDFELDACETGLELLDSKHLVYNTPDDSPNPTSDFAGKSPAERSAKRVGFALAPNHIEDKKDICSRSEEAKPKRSILKQSTPFSSDPPSSDLPPSEELGFPAMLDQLIKGLASQDISARYDAYMSMNGCLKAYSDIPSRKSLAGSMSILDGYIRRDLVLDSGAGVKASQTITEALKLVTQLCWFTETKPFMTAGFQVFLLNHAITVLGKEDTSKNLVNLYLYLLSVQTFPVRVMNQEKVVRILSVIKGIAGRVQGRQAVAHRLAIYRRLIGQAKGTMASKANLWMEDLFNNMMSRTKTIRERAIALGFVAGQYYGSEADIAVADAVRRLMNSKKSPSADTKYIDDVILRLQGWLDSKQNTVDIPAIWSIVILLLRSRPNYPKQWEHLPQWLRLIQGCLNINDSRTRSEANLAWIRLIYIIRPEANTAKSFSNLLFRPMKKQLERQEREKDATGELRKNVDGAYITLLYYAFRPGTDFETLDRYWHEYVVPVFSQEKGLLIDQSLACNILVSLFGCTQRSWQTDRALDTTCVLTAAELSRIDCKWVRSRAHLIISILEKYMSELDPEISDDSCSWKNVWIAFLSAIKQAGAKEIKVSSETMSAMAELLNLFQRITISPNLCDLPKGAWIMDCLYRQLGNLPFLEERIVDGKENGQFSAMPISSDRSKDGVRSPLNVLMETILKCMESSSLTMDDLNLPSIQKCAAFFTTAAELMQAGYKQLPVHIRHNASGVKYSKILDELQHATLDSASDLRINCQKLYDFASWLHSHVNGQPSLPEGGANKIEVQANPVEQIHNENIVIVARTTSAELPSTQIPSVEDTGLDDNEFTSEGIMHPENVIATPKANSRRSRGPLLQQQPRIRHDNSQIEFASIDSSPSILKAFDSQLLTERQKEVKERQSDEAGALFRDISSSTGPKLRTVNTPRLQLSGHDRAKIGYERCGSSSPILPPGDSMVVFLGSPTPNQRRLSTKDNISTDIATSAPVVTTSLIQYTLDDPPSSPPSRALEVLQGLSTVSHEEMTHMPREVDKPGNIVSSTVYTSTKDHECSTEDPFHTPALLQQVPSSNQVDTSTGDLTSLLLDISGEKQAIHNPEAPAKETEMADDPHSSSDDEDDQLISSQIDQDLKRASQDTIFVDSPKKARSDKVQGEQMFTPERKSPRTVVKRASPTSEEILDDEPPRKRAKVQELPDAERIEVVPTPQDIVSELQALLQKAKSRLDAQQGLAILQISAEFTQLAVKAIQG